MKVSEITVDNIIDFLKLDIDADKDYLKIVLDNAISYVSDYTGLPISSQDKSVADLDTYSPICHAIMVICQDMYDNRSYRAENLNINRVVSSILDMYSINYL